LEQEIGPPRTLRASQSGVQTDPEPGVGSSRPRKRRWLWLPIALVLIYVAWHFYASRGKGQSQDPAAASGGRAAIQSVPVAVTTAQIGDLPVFFNGLGSVTALNTVTVRTRVDGQLINVAFREGQFVHPGDLLAQIDPRPFQVQLEQAEGQLARDAAQLHDANVNYDRFVVLYKEGIIAKQQLDTQQAQVGQLDGTIKADQGAIDSAKLNLTYCRITSPIGGRVGLRLVDPGNMVHPTDQNGLLVITQLQPIGVLFSLPQDQLPEVYKKLRAGTPLTVEAYDSDNTSKIETGKLLTIDNQIDLTTGTYKLKAIFDNQKSILFPNQFVNAHLLVDTKRGVTVVPAAAIQRGPQGTYVYVVNGNIAKIRTVSVTLTSGNNVAIGTGLQPGEVVVTDGQDKLQDGSKVDVRTPTGAPPRSSQ
jgi:multidrug efflux system membrane fusion protein